MKKINNSAVIATTQEAIQHLKLNPGATGNQVFIWINDRKFLNTDKDNWCPYVELLKEKSAKTDVCAIVAGEIYWMDLPEGFRKAIERRGIIEVLEVVHNVYHPVFGNGYIIKEKMLQETSGKMLYVKFQSDCIWVDEKNITYIK